jgi:hypothetical protein
MVERRGRPKAPAPDNIQIQRLRTLAALAGDPDCVTQIYVLRRLKLISEPQYFAAEQVASIYHRWHKLTGTKPHPKTASLEFTTAGAADYDEDWQEVEKAIETKILCDRLDRCFDPRRREERAVIYRLCVLNEAVTRLDLHDTVYRVLNRVSVEFDLGPQPEMPALSATRGRKPRVTRTEKLESGAYAAPDVTHQPSHKHAPGSAGERDHANLVRLLEERQAQREKAEAAS